MTNDWYKKVTFYQIYPRSFCDSNGDGIGDIQGIISKLDYLKELGIGAIWLSPVYKSPNTDFGYDISDYRAINPEYGTIDDMKQLFAEAKKRDIKVVMDLVINHTSSEHHWFKEAQDPSSPYHDYYIWKEPKKDKLGRETVPNNWRSYFSGSTWEKSESIGKYYLHIFGKHQPDLNYRNPKVIEEVKDVMRYWLEMGAAGFRCDVINIIYKDSFEDGKGDFMSIIGSEHYYSTEGSVRILKEIQRDVLKPYGAFTVGETTGVTIEAANRFIDEGCLDTVFSFDHMATDEWRIPLFKVKYRPEKMKKSLIKWQEAVGWNSLFFENHDQQRSVSRFGDPRYRDESAKMLATVLLTLKGSPFIYQGQEIGMTNTKFKDMSEIRDIDTLNTYNTLRMYGVLPPLARKLAMNLCRDHARTPMQWSAEGPSAGFSASEDTWLPVNQNYKEINVESQRHDQGSISKYYADLIKFRNASEALQSGEVKGIKSHDEVLAFLRTGDNEAISVVANLSAKYLPVPEGLSGEVIFSNYNDGHGKGLRPFEAIVSRQS